MRTFTCGQCGHPITVPDIMLGQEITCDECQTPQAVPQDAPIAPESRAVTEARAQAAFTYSFQSPGWQVPEYVPARVIALLMRIAGVLCMGLGLLAFLDRRASGWNILFAGLTTFVLGQILAFARIIARQTYRNPHDR